MTPESTRTPPNTTERCPISGQSPGEERFNWISHGVGTLLGIAGTVVLIILAARWGSARHIVGAAIFGASLIVLYGFSTLYHSAWSLRWKRVLRQADHMAIYLLIAGTYTPFALGPLHGPWGWSLLGVIWGMAAVGITFKIWFTHRFTLFSTIGYVVMGWVAVVALGPLSRALTVEGLVLLIFGGVAYTIGAVFYLFDYRIPAFHPVFHVFIVIGSATHYGAVVDYLYNLS